jgi:stage II sporulation protein P
MMSRTAYVGDELYTSEGKSYRITRVQGDTAEAVFLGMDSQIIAYNDFFSAQEVPVLTNLAEKKGNIAVYHSHTDESYVPSDGTESIPSKAAFTRWAKPWSINCRKRRYGEL